MTGFVRLTLPKCKLGSETYLVSLGVAVMPIWVADWKYSKILRHRLSSLAEPL